MAHRVPSLRTRCDYYEHLHLPNHYIARVELLAQLRQPLLNGSGPAALTSAIQADALHGMGGIGKTVMARALCDDPAVRNHFADGILLARLGSETTSDDVRRWLREWIGVLGGIIPETQPSLTSLSHNLAQLLHERACLLILDDVWCKADVEPFLVGGPRCRLLLTTRDAELARDLGAHLLPVPVLEEAQAVTLLQQWAVTALAGVAEEEKGLIVNRLGRLALAVKLAGAQLRNGQPPTEWLASFDVRKLKMRRGNEIHDSLAATFSLSLDALPVDQRALYAALLIFREDEAIPSQAIATLWRGLANYNAPASHDLLYDLDARALLQYNRPAAGAGMTTPGHIIIHDLLRDFLAGELSADARLQAHQALLAIYRQTRRGAAWATAPDDGYLYTHLAYHLAMVADAQPAALAELTALFANDEWMQVRVANDGYIYDGFLADLKLLWERATQQALAAIADDRTSEIAACVRCALLYTSVNSLAANYVPEMVRQAVASGLAGWSAERAIALAVRVPDTEKRVHFCTQLLTLDNLTSDQRNRLAAQALAAAQAIRAEKRCAEALASLVPHLTGEKREQALAQGLKAAQSIRSEQNRVRTLMELVPYLTGEQKERTVLQILVTTLTDKNETFRSSIMAGLAPHLTGELLSQGIVVAQRVRDKRRLTQHLMEGRKEQGLTQGLIATLGIRDEGQRASAIAGLAPYLTNELLNQGLAAAQAIKDEGWRAKALAGLVPYLPDDLLNQGLAAAQAIKNKKWRVEVLAGLAPRLTDELLSQGLSLAQAITDESWRASALVWFAPYLTNEQLSQGLAVAQSIEDNDWRAKALTELAVFLTGNQKEYALAQGLAAAQAIDNDRWRSEALTELSMHLAGERKEQTLERALASAQVIKDEKEKAEEIARLAKHLTDKLLNQGLLEAKAIKDEWWRVDALVGLALFLTSEQREQVVAQALTAAQASEDEWRRAKMLAGLVPHLTSEQQEQAVVQALAAAQAIEDEWQLAEALAGLAPHLTGELVGQALATAQTIEDEWKLAEALVGLAPHLTGELVSQAWATAQAIQDEGRYARTLAKLAPYLTGELVSRALTAAQSMGDAESRAEALVGLAPHLMSEQQEQALTQSLAAAQAIEDEWRRARTRTLLVPHLTGEPQEQVVAQVLAAQVMWDENSRVEVLAGLASHLTGELQEQVVAQALAAAQVIWDERSRAEALARLAPHLMSEQQEYALVQALAAAQVIRSEGSRAGALAGLAPHLTGALLGHALAAAQTIEDEESRAEALAGLAPHLTGVQQEQVVAQALAAAQAIKDEERRAEALAELLAVGRGASQGRLLREARATQCRYLFTLQSSLRAAVLQFLANKTLFAPPILDPPTLGAIADHISEIGTQWRWL